MQRRRKLVEDVGMEIDSMRQELEKPFTASSAGKGGAGGASALPNPSDFDNLLSPEDGRGGDDYYSSLEQQRQVELMQEQDQQLDGVFRTVGNLRQQADDMGRELEEQAVMLDEVDTLADRVGGKLQNGVRRLGLIVRKNEGKCCLSHALHFSILRPIYIACYKDWKKRRKTNCP